MSSSSLSQADIRLLDKVMSFLATPVPLPVAAPIASHDETVQSVIAVSGNWYDVASKAPVIARIVQRRPRTTILLTGGRNERLTPPSAVELGGEPLLLQSELYQRYNVSRSSMVLYSGSRITNHNLQAMLMFAATAQRFERRAISLQILEEAFLVRRESAALAAMLLLDPTACRPLASLRIRPVGARRFEQLVAMHGGHSDVALALVVGEVLRLRQYSTPVNVTAPGLDNVVLSAEAARLDPRLAGHFEQLLMTHRSGLLASGRALLANRARLFASGAAPGPTPISTENQERPRGRRWLTVNGAAPGPGGRVV